MAEENTKRSVGRPKGSLNKTSQANIELVTKDGGQSPLEFLASIYQSDLESKQHRIDAAKAAAPYCHPKLQAIEVTADILAMSHEEWIKTLQ